MKRIVFNLILITGIFSCFLLNVDAATNPYKKTSSYGINCTWYAWEQVYTKTGVVLPSWGNANTWLDSAKKAGYETGMTPRAKSIAVWKWSSYGHVGYVERVSGGKIYAWDSDKTCVASEDEEKCFENSIDEESYRSCMKTAKVVACEYDATYWSTPGDLIGYIYLDKVPTNSNNTSSTNITTATENNSNTSVKKSNNANLKSLSISDIDFTFKKDISKYEFVVENNIDKIEITAKTEDSKATLEVKKEYSLEVGMNTIEVIVTAEDNTKQTYTLEIKRKDNNAYLKSLDLSVGNIEFLKDVFNYEIEVDKNTEKINVEATSESSIARIEGLGEYNLNENDEITIKVIAEDSTENIYTIKVLKKEKVEEENKENKKDNKLKYMIYISTFIVVLISLLVFIIKKKKIKEKSK